MGCRPAAHHYHRRAWPAERAPASCDRRHHLLCAHQLAGKSQVPTAVGPSLHAHSPRTRVLFRVPVCGRRQGAGGIWQEQPASHHRHAEGLLASVLERGRHHRLLEMYRPEGPRTGAAHRAQPVSHGHSGCRRHTSAGNGSHLQLVVRQVPSRDDTVASGTVRLVGPSRTARPQPLMVFQGGHQCP